MKVRSSSSRMPSRLASKPGIMRSLPMTSGNRSDVAPSTGWPSRRPSKPMTAKSSACAPRSSTGTSTACWSRSCSMTASTWTSLTSSTCGVKGIARVVAQDDLGADRQGDAVGRALALLEARPLGLPGQLQDVAVGLSQRLQHGALVEVLAGLVVDGVGRVGVGAVDAQRSLEDRPRRLPGPEAGDAGAAGEVPHAFVDGLLELLGGELDLQHDGAAVACADVGLHGVLDSLGMAGSATRV